MKERSVIDTGTGPTPPTSHLFTAGNMMLKKAKRVSLDCWDTKRIFLVKTGHEMTKHKTILGRVQGPSLKPWVGIGTLEQDSGLYNRAGRRHVLSQGLALL